MVFWARNKNSTALAKPDRSQKWPPGNCKDHLSGPRAVESGIRSKVTAGDVILSLAVVLFHMYCYTRPSTSKTKDGRPKNAGAASHDGAVVSRAKLATANGPDTTIACLELQNRAGFWNLLVP